nr:putative coat protein [Nigrospora aurantiaca tobamo-like virus 1]
MNFTMSAFCILCQQTVTESLDSHINERHSSPEKKTRDLDGVPTDITDADWVRMNQAGGAGPSGGGATGVVAPTPTIFDSLGIRMQDLEVAESEVEAGASCTETEAKKVFEAAEALVGFKIDRAHFLINFIDWGFRTSFSEELTEAGGWKVRSATTAGDKVQFVKVSVLHAAVRDHLGESDTGRDFTFRRLGRTFARQIPTLVTRNKSLAKYMRVGTDMSNRLGVAPAFFLCCTSIFESIKPYTKWSDDELAAWRAHNAAVKKVARDSRRRPEDLRPDPEMAARFSDSGYSDWADRVSERYGHSGPSGQYGKGEDIFRRMWGNEDKRSPGDRRGIGN